MLYLQGYLGDCLSQQCGLVVIGLEREQDRVQAATRRANQIHQAQDTSSKVQSVELFCGVN